MLAKVVRLGCPDWYDVAVSGGFKLNGKYR